MIIFMNIFMSIFMGIFMRMFMSCARIFRIAIALSLVGITPSLADDTTLKGAPKDAARVNDIRMWHAPQRSRIVFDIDRRIAFKSFTLSKPDRVVIDLPAVKIEKSPPPNAGQFIRRIRFGTPVANVARVVFDLDKPVRYFIKLFKPSGPYQYRLVVDFYPIDAVVESERIAQSSQTKPPPKSAKSELLILVDPGHGGEDPGAVGKHTHEKKVVLAIAKKLKARVDQRPGLRAELTRAGDYYVPLRKRTRIARTRQADLFVSIHADAFTNNTARGASVYALSQRGASSETAKWLADKENAADLVGGVSLADKDNLLAEVLLDLSMSKTVSESISFGRDVLAELKKVGRVHSERVEQAGFVVLKSPDIPSILIETAYITNPHEEKLLMTAGHQNRIADAITAGIVRYLRKNGNRHVR